MSFRSYCRTMASVLCLGIAAACVSTPMPIQHPPLPYAKMEKMRFKVAEVLVINDATTTTATEQLGQYGKSPEAAMREWAANRITGTGSQGTFSLIIRDANFAIQKLPMETGFKSWGKRQQAERWDAYLNVIIAVEGGGAGQTPAEVNISVRSSQTLPEEASDSEKRQTYTSVMNKLMTLFDAEAQKQINAYFSGYMM